MGRLAFRVLFHLDDAFHYLDHKFGVEDWPIIGRVGLKICDVFDEWLWRLKD